MFFLKPISSALYISFVLLVGSGVGAQVNELAEHKSFPIESVVSARWIDRENGSMSLTFLSLYPNGCYSLESSAGFTATADKRIYISQTVNVIEGLCTMAIVSQTDQTTILVPEMGEYTVIDALTNRKLGTLILKATEFSYFAQ